MKFLYHPVTAAIVTLFVILFYISLFQTQQRFQSTAGTITSFSDQNDQMKQEVAALEKLLEQATSSAYREKMIRDQLLMQKPGEYVLQVPEMPTNTPQATPEATPTPWEAWLRLLK